MARFQSLGAVLFTSFLALMSLLVRSYVDTRYILVEDFADMGQGFVGMWIIGYSLVVGGWVWSLISAGRGSTRALYALLVLAIAGSAWFGLGSIILYADHPVEFVIFGASLITGCLAIASILLHIKPSAA
jgi:hypothetical protein